MSNICIRVNKAESSFNGKQWILNHTDVEGPFGCFGETHDVILYEQILLKTGQDIESKMPLDFENLHFEVRNAYDPWMAAIELTEDTMNFGMKTKNMRFLGIGLMFCCGGLLLQPCFWMFKNFFWSWSIEDSVDRLAAQHYIVDVESSNSNFEETKETIDEDEKAKGKNSFLDISRKKISRYLTKGTKESQVEKYNYSQYDNMKKIRNES